MGASFCPSTRRSAISSNIVILRVWSDDCEDYLKGYKYGEANNSFLHYSEGVIKIQFVSVWIVANHLLMRSLIFIEGLSQEKMQMLFTLRPLGSVSELRPQKTPPNRTSQGSGSRFRPSVVGAPEAGHSLSRWTWRSGPMLCWVCCLSSQLLLC